MVRLSFVVLSHRRPRMLLECLESLHRPPPPEGIEVLVGLNGFDPRHEEASREIAARLPGVRVVQLEPTPRGEARNRLVREARGGFLFFLDDDTVAPDGLAGRVLAKLDAHPEAPAMGGPNLAPAGSSGFQHAVDFLLRSPLGSGPMRVRFSRSGVDRPLPGWCFNLCNLGVRRDVFETRKIAFPDTASAEENLLLHRVEREVGPVLFSPDLFVYHVRRDRISSFCRQAFLSGQGRAQITRAAPESLQAAVLAPVLLLAYLLCLPWLARGLQVGPILVYFVGWLVEAARLAMTERDLGAAAWLAPAALAGHLSYAAGLLVGAAGIVPLAAVPSVGPKGLPAAKAISQSPPVPDAPRPVLSLGAEER